MTKQLAINVMGLANQPGTPLHIMMHGNEELIERSCRGDDEAFRTIFERYSKPVTGFIFGMIGERGLAEELAQETFVRAHRKMASLKDANKLSTWLFGIAKNVAREAIQTRRLTQQRSQPGVGLIENLSDNALLPDEQLLKKELHSVIEHALDTLDADKRMVFTLRIFQQRSYEEIVEVTGFTMAKVKTDIHRARAEMRRLIRPYREVDDAL
jgi:RNA polymerase sigma-70 factor (ECF subfamily)